MLTAIFKPTLDQASTGVQLTLTPPNNVFITSWTLSGSLPTNINLVSGDSYYITSSGADESNQEAVTKVGSLFRQHRPFCNPGATPQEHKT